MCEFSDLSLWKLFTDSLKLGKVPVTPPAQIFKGLFWIHDLSYKAYDKFN